MGRRITSLSVWELLCSALDNYFKNPIAGSRNAQSHFLTSSSRTLCAGGAGLMGKLYPDPLATSPVTVVRSESNRSLGHEIFLMVGLRVQMVLLHFLLFLAHTQSEKQNYLCLNPVISMARTCCGLNGQGLNFSFTSRIMLWSLCNKFVNERILWTHSGNIHARIVSLAKCWILQCSLVLAASNNETVCKYEW